MPSLIFLLKLQVLDGCQVSASSLNEVQAIAAGRTQQTPLRHAIDIYHIARFLNLHRLAQCEFVLLIVVILQYNQIFISFNISLKYLLLL